MKVTSWKVFITNHPDSEELGRAAAAIHQLINLEDTVDQNLERVTASEGIVMVTNDTFSGNPLPVFFHHRLSLPIPGAKPRLVGLTGFGSHASPIELEAKRMFDSTKNTIPTPSLRDFFEASKEGIDALRNLQPREDEKHHIRLTAILFPQLTNVIMTLESISAATLLLQAVTAIQRLKPIDLATTNEADEAKEPNENEVEEDLDYAKDFLPLLVTLGSFLRSKEETKAITPPRKVQLLTGGC